MFKQFGGKPEHYQEFNHQVRGFPGAERTLAADRNAGLSLEKASSDEGAESTEASAFDHPLCTPAPPVDIAQPTYVAQAVAATHDWSSAGLRSLLTQLPEQAPSHTNRVEAAAKQRPNLDHLQIIAVMSAKGGVGKTTLTANLGTALRRTGRQVAVVDLDPQNGLHHHFQPVDGQAFDLEQGGIAQPSDHRSALGMFSTDSVLLVPYGNVEQGHRDALEQNLRSDPLWLARHLADLPLEHGAIVLLDTPPGSSSYLRQALSVANTAVAVSLPDVASYTTLPQIDKLVAAYTEGRADFDGVSYVINQVDPGHLLSKNIAQVLQGLLGGKVLGVVQRDPAIGEALAFNRNVLVHAPDGRGSHDLLLCAQALAERLAVACSA
nr:cellulose biosynthesis protein BcsQ [Pseudomonas sp.]